MAVAYAKRSDVFQGFPAGALSAPARPIASVDVATNRIEVQGHACAAGTPVQFQVDRLGVLPAPFAVSTVYFAKPVEPSDSLLEVSATLNGPSVDITTVGVGSFKLFVPIGPLIDVLCLVYSRWFDGKLIGHEVPLTPPFPVEATHIVAVRVRAHAARMLGLGAQGEQFFAAEELVLRDVAALVNGVKLRDRAATGPANLAVAASGSAIPFCQESIP